MFREDFEFHDEAGPSHHGGKAVAREADEAGGPAPQTPRSISEPKEAGDMPHVTPSGEIVWLPAAEKELKKIPFFVRGKARREHRNLRG